MTEGPFYPTKLPLDTDNDLLVINDSLTPGVGEITHLTGKVVDLAGKPVNNACVEIWQCDDHGAYLHQGSDNGSKRDKNFQGFGRFVTSSTGEFYFRTIKPVPYPGRTPHIHVKVKRGGKELLCSQLFVADHPGNARDGIYRGVRDEKAKASVTSAYTAGQRLEAEGTRRQLHDRLGPDPGHGLNAKSLAAEAQRAPRIPKLEFGILGALCASAA